MENKQKISIAIVLIAVICLGGYFGLRYLAAHDKLPDAIKNSPIGDALQSTPNTNTNSNTNTNQNQPNVNVNPDVNEGKDPADFSQDHYNSAQNTKPQEPDFDPTQQDQPVTNPIVGSNEDPWTGNFANDGHLSNLYPNQTVPDELAKTLTKVTIRGYNVNDPVPRDWNIFSPKSSGGMTSPLHSVVRVSGGEWVVYLGGQSFNPTLGYYYLKIGQSGGAAFGGWSGTVTVHTANGDVTTTFANLTNDNNFMFYVP